MFKTISECRLEVVGHTLLLDSNSDGYDWYDSVKDEYLYNADFMPCSAARASFGNENKTGQNEEADKKLMHYLAEHKHLTPFEYQHATFLVECPLFIRSQIHRHRTFSYNEISRRYTSEDLEFWIPDTLRGQSKNNKQASDGVVEDYESVWQFRSWQEDWDEQHRETLQLFNSMVEQGVAREIARAVLPQSLLTRFYMGGNLRNWVHFLQLRKDSHAQFEVRVIADKIDQKLRELWPESMKALMGEYEAFR